MRLTTMGLSALAAILLGGCAGQGGGGGSLPSPSGEGTLRWSGSLKPTTQRKGDLGMADQARAFGTVMLTRSASDPERTDVRITISTPASAAGNFLPWAMLPGRCGSGAVPLMSLEQFGQIDVGTNSRGELRTSLALPLPESGTYHANVYWPRGSQLSDVMTCANLER